MLIEQATFDDVDGLALLKWRDDIQSVFVVPEHRAHGIGTELVSAAYQHAVAAGAAKVVVNSSVGAVSLYRRLGFDFSPVLLVRDAVD